MEFQVLISTMNQADYSLLDKMRIQSDAVVVNQCDADRIVEIDYKEHRVLWVDSAGRGLSLSRNTAMKHASAQIILFADDDLEYVDDYQNIIVNEFHENPEADILVFQVEGIEKQFKKYTPHRYKVNYLKSMKVSSVEIAVKLDSLRKAGLTFNELFGAGSKYQMGEENIFLFNCIKKGLKIYSVPVKIADLHIGDSTWFKGFDSRYFVSRGAGFTAMTRTFSLLLIFQFALRRYKLYRNGMSMRDAVKYMLAGRKQLLSEIKD